MPAAGGSVEIHAAFAREGRALAAVSHPALPRLGAFFEESGIYYAIEERIDGRPLADAVHRGATLSQAAITRALRSALEALTHLHQQSRSIIHRAVHPAHIVQASDGRVFLTGAGGLREAVLGRGRAVGHLARSQAYEAPGSGIVRPELAMRLTRF